MVLTQIKKRDGRIVHFDAERIKDAIHKAFIAVELGDGEKAEDVNVSTLLVMAFRAQEDAEKGLIPGLSQERFLGRPGLVADEVLGLAIAGYIAGTRGLFEYTRFDQAKPGILKKLGPITNDAIGALVASVSSNMYTKALRKE